MSHHERAREVINLEIDGLSKVRDGLQAGFDQAVDRMLHSLENKGKIVVTGIGKNLHIAEKICATLTSTGSSSVLVNASQAVHGDLGILNDGDVLLVLSYSGESEEILTLVAMARAAEIDVVSLTGVLDSSLAKASDIVVSVTVDREACPFDMAPTVSTTAALAVGDALAMVLLEARGFTRDDYARLHPGGAIGRALTLRVRDFMREDDRLAKVQVGQKVRDAIIAMTSARAGSAGVVDAQGCVVGIFTDGDFRRRIADVGDLLDHSIDEVMSADPITTGADQYAADVARLFAHHEIDDILVVDEDNRLIGQVDIQQLPKMKML